MTIEEFLERRYGYNDNVKRDWRPYVDEWRDWYEGYVADFHPYTIYNGRNNIDKERRTLNMAKKCCEDWADLLFNNKCTITLSNMEQNETLQNILNDLNFWEFTNRAIEKAGSVGTGAIVLSIDNIIDTGMGLDVSDVKPRLSYIDIQNIYPISWSNEKITECAFSNTDVKGGNPVCYLSVHKVDEQTGEYVIHNYTFKLDKDNQIVEEVPMNAVFNRFKTGSDKAWFFIISPNSNNNKQINSPFGLSFFANSIDILKSIDIGFDCFINEIDLSRKRIFVRDELIDYGPDGKSHPVFHATDVAVYTLPNGMDKEDMIQAENSQIRSDALEKYIKNMLALFADSVGFDSHFYAFENNTKEKTATEVISDKDKMFRRKKKHEIVLESALYDLISCLCYALSNFGMYNLSDEGLTIKFDDSVVENVAAIAERSITELRNGIISVVEYRERVFGESESLAMERYEQVLQEKKQAKESNVTVQEEIVKVEEQPEIAADLEKDLLNED